MQLQSQYCGHVFGGQLLFTQSVMEHSLTCQEKKDSSMWVDAIQALHSIGVHPVIFICRSNPTDCRTASMNQGIWELITKFLRDLAHNFLWTKQQLQIKYIIAESSSLRGTTPKQMDRLSDLALLLVHTTKHSQSSTKNKKQFDFHHQNS